jgi:hypothetical protein
MRNGYERGTFQLLGENVASNCIHSFFCSSSASIFNLPTVKKNIVRG